MKLRTKSNYHNTNTIVNLKKGRSK